MCLNAALFESEQKNPAASSWHGVLGMVQLVVVRAPAWSIKSIVPDLCTNDEVQLRVEVDPWVAA